jgi:hypothetical protein
LSLLRLWPEEGSELASPPPPGLIPEVPRKEFRRIGRLSSERRRDGHEGHDVFGGQGVRIDAGSEVCSPPVGARLGSRHAVSPFSVKMILQRVHRSALFAMDRRMITEACYGQSKTPPAQGFGEALRLWSGASPTQPRWLASWERLSFHASHVSSFIVLTGACHVLCGDARGQDWVPFRQICIQSTYK